MSDFLYNLIIRPLYLFFEFVFVKAYGLTGNYGYTIIVLSLTINFLVLPLYRSADAMQKEEREKEEKLSYWVDHIKKTFKGDERYMMLQTYYRQNNFKQTDSLKGTVSLVLQIPFFIAAYRFLSGLRQLDGISFGLLRDLGKPDGMISLGGISVNVLPILMTTINLVSGAIYTKGMAVKSKIQLYAMALIFLVLLYRSPSGLVFYWTLNNLFSLCKNIAYKLPEPKRTLSRLAAVISPILFFGYYFTRRDSSKIKLLFILGISCVLLLPIAWERFGHLIRPFLTIDKKDENDNHLKWFYRAVVLYLTVLMGVLIPSAVVVSSPTDFIDSTNYQNPLVYVLYTLNIMAGFFLIWCSVFYMLEKKNVRKYMVGGLWVLAGVFTIDYIFFARKLGNMSAELVYDTIPEFSLKQKLFNMIVLLLVSVIFWFIWEKKRTFVPTILGALFLSTGVLLFQNISGTQRQLAGLTDYLQKNETGVARIPLSRNGKNVVVFMLDRAMGPYVPYLLNERPDLKEKFRGFTYYHNTVSMGTSTNAGSGALFGGYEYSAYEINKRADESLMEKQNEALKVMPVLFGENGYTVTVCDPPYAGYKWIGDLSIYDEYPYVNAYHTKGKFDQEIKKNNKSSTQRNFVGYSFMKVMPLMIQHSFYDRGNYNNTDTDIPDYSEKFMDSYTVLENLPAITEVSDSDNNTFFMIDNETAHEPCKLQVPEYVPARHCDNGDFEEKHAGRFTLNGVTMKTDTAWRLYHYYANMAVFLKMADWFDYLRENGVYDNTRIILVSDHGFRLEQFEQLTASDGFDLEFFCPLFMVKDFNAKEFTESEEFMTNADTPVLATDGLIDNPVNPFTGNRISSKTKEDNDVIVFHTDRWQINENNGNTFGDDKENRWFWIHDNIYDSSNWELLDDPYAR